VFVDNDNNRLMDLPWSEKHRPSGFSGMVGNQEIIQRLQSFAPIYPPQSSSSTSSSFSDNNNSNIRATVIHLIMEGGSGRGKSTAARCLCQHLFGDPSKIPDNTILRIDISLHRGASTVDNITRFCSLLHELQPRLVILEEADSMSDEMQASLPHVIRMYTATVRFILLCNNKEKLSEHFRSECRTIQFAPLTPAEIEMYLIHVAKCESLDYDPVVLKHIAENSDNDARAAVLKLQDIAMMAGKGQRLTVELAEDISSEPNQRTMRTFFNTCLSIMLQSTTATVQSSSSSSMCLTRANNTNFILLLKLWNELVQTGITEIAILNNLVRILNVVLNQQQCLLSSSNACFFGKTTIEEQDIRKQNECLNQFSTIISETMSVIASDRVNKIEHLQIHKFLAQVVCPWHHTPCE